MNAKERRAQMREEIARCHRAKGRSIEAFDMLDYLEKIGIKVNKGERRQWRRAVGGMWKKYHMLRISPFKRDGERWGRYTLLETS